VAFLLASLKVLRELIPAFAAIWALYKALLKFLMSENPVATAIRTYLDSFK